MNEASSDQSPEPSEGMQRLGEIFKDIVTTGDLFNGMQEAQIAIRKQEADIRDLESEIAATLEERTIMIEAGASEDAVEQINLRLLGLMAIRQDYQKHPQNPGPQ